MDDRLASNDSLLDFARFVSIGLVDAHREKYPDFPRGTEVEEIVAQALVYQYRRDTNPPPIPIQAKVSGATFDSSDDNSTFPLDFDVNVVVGSLHAQVTNPSSGEYVLIAKFSIFGKNLDTTKIRFKDGELSRTEDFGAFGQSVKFTFTIDFSNGFNLRIEGDAKTFFKNFHIGPYDVHI